LGMQQRLRESYLEMAFNDSASCAPVGMAWKKSIAIDSTLNLYSSDNSHPSIYGSYLAACTFYASIFKKSAVGSSYWPNAIDSLTALSLQEIGSSTVLDSLAVWNIFDSYFTFDQMGDSVSFTNLSSNYESLLWNFGDGETTTDQHPTHTYAANGSYTIQLIATTNSGCITDTLTATVVVSSINGVEQLQAPAQLQGITDVFGRESKAVPNVPLFYRYDDRTVEKKIILE